MPGTARRYRVWWETLNSGASGVVEGKPASDTYFVRLDNGKHSLVHMKSIRKWEESQSG